MQRSFDMETSVEEPMLQTIRDLHELESLREIWESWTGPRNTDLEFFSSLVRSRGLRCRPHVMVINRDARPDAMLIGLRERKRLPFRIGTFTIWEPEVNMLHF